MSGVWIIQKPVTAYTPVFVAPTVTVTTTTTYIVPAAPSPPPPSPQMHVFLADVCVLSFVSIIPYPYAAFSGLHRRRVYRCVHARVTIDTKRAPSVYFIDCFVGSGTLCLDLATRSLAPLRFSCLECLLLMWISPRISPSP
jgi:hypothetical protein